jgi:signal transduction histidine kinase
LYGSRFVGDGSAEAEREAVDLLRRRVLNVVGHELRTPITTLRGLAELLGRSNDDAAEAELHDAIRRVARRTESLLDDLLIGTGVTTALPVGAPVDAAVAATARAVWADLDLDGKGVLHVDGDATVLARPDVLRRILSAVLDNAARYGSAPVEVHVAQRNGRVAILVRDHGPGIPAAELPLVTEPFFRGERAVLEHHSLGLGLAVVAALVAEREGRLTIGNREGGGVEVEVEL